MVLPPRLAVAHAVDALCEVSAIDTLLSNFIRPLQGGEIATVDSNGNLGRIHCSLNINTETGRLSARRPNLQNQPALEKDRYKVSLLTKMQRINNRYSLSCSISKNKAAHVKYTFTIHTHAGCH